MLNDWMSPINSALDSITGQVDIFFRDDDAGWDDQRLMALLGCFHENGIPIDLAVIPQATDHGLADTLLERLQGNKSLLAFHQHGLNHTNHEQEGRKCEFGKNRSKENQLNDILIGKNRLEKLFGSALDPIFTPPWNRCTAITAACLVDLKFHALSRNSTADKLNMDGLQEIPVAIDWCGIRASSTSPWPELGQRIAEHLKVRSPKPIGIMLHHAVMDDLDLEQLGNLFKLLVGYKQTSFRLMREFLVTY